MAAIQRIIFLAFMAASLLHVASAIAGQATYYGPGYTPSSCYGFEDHGTMIAAAPAGIFNNKAACGTRYTIRCTSGNGGGGCHGGSVTVTIVDLCPGCAANQFDLSQEAFSQIADLGAGRIGIDYNRA